MCPLKPAKQPIGDVQPGSSIRASGRTEGGEENRVTGGERDVAHFTPCVSLRRNSTYSTQRDERGIGAELEARMEARWCPTFCAPVVDNHVAVVEPATLRCVNTTPWDVNVVFSVSDVATAWLTPLTGVLTNTRSNITSGMPPWPAAFAGCNTRAPADTTSMHAAASAITGEQVFMMADLGRENRQLHVWGCAFNVRAAAPQICPRGVLSKYTHRYDAMPCFDDRMIT